MSDLEKLIRKITSDAIQGNENTYKTDLFSLLSQYKNNPYYFLKNAKSIHQRIKKNIPEKVIKHNTFDKYLKKFKKIHAECSIRVLKEDVKIENYLDSLVEMQLLDTFVGVHKIVKEVRDKPPRKMGINSYCMFLSIFYLIIYERIGYRIKLMYKILENDINDEISIGDVIKYFKEKPDYKDLFNSMNNKIRNSIAHGNYRLNRDDKIIIFNEDENIKMPYDDFFNLVDDVIVLLYSIFLAKADVELDAVNKKSRQVILNE